MMLYVAIGALLILIWLIELAGISWGGEKGTEQGNDDIAWYQTTEGKLWVKREIAQWQQGRRKR